MRVVIQRLTLTDSLLDELYTVTARSHTQIDDMPLDLRCVTDSHGGSARSVLQRGNCTEYHGQYLYPNYGTTSKLALAVVEGRSVLVYLKPEYRRDVVCTITTGSQVAGTQL